MKNSLHCAPPARHRFAKGLDDETHVLASPASWSIPKAWCYVSAILPVKFLRYARRVRDVRNTEDRFDDELRP